MKAITGWRVVNDNRVLELSIDPAQILNKNALVMCALFSEKSVADKSLWVKPVQKRIRILSKGSCVDDELIPFGTFLKELINSRSLEYKNFADAVFNLNRKYKITVLDFSKT